MSVFIFVTSFIGASVGGFVMEDRFRPESRRIMTLLIFGSLRGDVCIVVAPAKGLYLIRRSNFQKNFKKRSGIVPDSQEGVVLLQSAACQLRLRLSARG